MWSKAAVKYRYEAPLPVRGQFEGKFENPLVTGFRFSALSRRLFFFRGMSFAKRKAPFIFFTRRLGVNAARVIVGIPNRENQLADQDRLAGVPQ